MSVNNGLGNRRPLTQSSYRTAIASTIAAVRNGYSDQDMADVWGVSAGTVNNAQNKNNDLSGLNLLKLGEKFGVHALDTVLELIGGRVVPTESVAIDVAKVPFEIASVLPLLIELLGDGKCTDSDVRRLEKAGAIEAILKVADYLRQRRDEVRLKD